MKMNHHHEHLLAIYNEAVKAVAPATLMRQALSLHGDRLQIGQEVVPLNTFKKIYVAGAGKAGAAMAHEAELILGELISDGVIAVKDFPNVTLKWIRPIVSGHPLPDVNSVKAAEEIMRLVESTTTSDLLIFLLSGGASSLMTDLPPFCELKDVHRMNELLVNSGATIKEINMVRKHISNIKGGQLARACKAMMVTFIISDVIGNDLSVIGSGPTFPDDTTYTDAMQVLERYHLIAKTPSAILDHLRKGLNNQAADTPGSDELLFRKIRNYIIGDIQVSLKAAASCAEKLGYRTTISDKLIEGNTEQAAQEFVEWTKTVSGDKQCFIAGGETTLNVTGSGTGGRNQHFSLAAASALRNENVSILAAGTDGSDGPTDAAGAIVDSTTFDVAIEKGMRVEDFLHAHDSYRFFEQAGGHVKPGATGTNVMDIIIGLKG